MSGERVDSKWVALGMSVVIVVLFCTAIYLVAGQRADSTAHASATAVEPQPPVVSAAPAPPREPTLAEQMAEASNFYAAYQLAKPYLADSVGSPSKGALMLAVWMGARGRFGDVYTSTGGPSMKLIKKDPSRVRGQVTCVRGRIVQIARVTDELFEGTIRVGYTDVIHYFAAGDTGSLVEGDAARFCGAITGLLAYENVAGGQTQSVQLVGMFDPNSLR